ncbi:hypothetical protein [Rhodovulum sp. YEN HP10]|uniref:hypothetical protein n=1 Tax=Rhodovulum sp. HP10 TaxID=3387397 RepID=UPI0039DF54B9
MSVTGKRSPDRFLVVLAIQGHDAFGPGDHGGEAPRYPVRRLMPHAGAEAFGDAQRRVLPVKPGPLGNLAMDAD